MGDLSASKKRSLLLLLFSISFFLLYSTNLQAEDSPIAAFDRAEDLFEKKKYSESLSLYEKVISLDSAHLMAYRGLVRSYVKLGDPQGGVIFMEDLYLDDTQNAGVCYGLGYANYYLKKYDNALRYFNEALTLNPDLAPAWNNGAAIYHHIKRDYEKAKEYYEKAIKVSQKTGDKRVLSIAERNLKNLPTPEEIKPLKENLTLEQFVNMFVSGVEEDNDRGIKLLVLGQKDNCEQAMDWFLGEAMQACAEGSKEEEKTALLFAKLLEREYRNGFQSDLLQRKMEKYIGLPDEIKKKIYSGEMLLNDGIEKETKGKFKKAVESYTGALSSFKAAKDKNRAGMTLLYIGDLYRKTKKHTDAKKAYLDSLTCFVESRDEPSKALVLSSLGITCYMLGQHSDAIEFLKRSKTAYHRLQDKESEEKVRKNIEQIENKVKSEQ